MTIMPLRASQFRCRARASTWTQAWTWLFLCGLAIASGLQSAAGQEIQSQPPRGAAPEQIRQWMDGLSAPSLADRERAEQSLLAAGPEVLPLLPTPESLRGETRYRLERIMTALEDRLALRAVQPTRVTVAGTRSLGETLDLISLLTGNSIRLGKPGLGTQQVTVAAAGDPFWKVVDDLLDRCQLTTDRYANEGQLVLVPSREQRRKMVAYAGPFRIAAERIEAVRDLRNEALDGLDLTLAIAWEPRLQPIAIQMPARKLFAIDDQGRDLSDADSPDVSEVLPIQGASQTEVRTALPLPLRSASSLQSLHGELWAVLPMATHRFEFFPLNSTQPDQTVSQIRVRVRSVEMQNELVNVQLLIQFLDPDVVLESHRQWIFDQPAYLLTPQGKRVENAGLEMIRQTTDQVGIGLLFAIEGEPSEHRLVCELPTGIKRVAIPFVLKDIPLP